MTKSGRDAASTFVRRPVDDAAPRALRLWMREAPEIPGSACEVKCKKRSDRRAPIAR